MKLLRQYQEACIVYFRENGAAALEPDYLRYQVFSQLAKKHSANRVLRHVRWISTILTRNADVIRERAPIRGIWHMRYEGREEDYKH